MNYIRRVIFQLLLIALIKVAPPEDIHTLKALVDLTRASEKDY